MQHTTYYEIGHISYRHQQEKQIIMSNITRSFLNLISYSTRKSLHPCTNSYGYHWKVSLKYQFQNTPQLEPVKPYIKFQPSINQDQQKQKLIHQFQRLSNTTLIMINAAVTKYDRHSTEPVAALGGLLSDAVEMSTVQDSTPT